MSKYLIWLLPITVLYLYAWVLHITPTDAWYVFPNLVTGLYLTVGSVVLAIIKTVD